MNRIASKIAKEIGVFFQNENFDAGASEQKAKHHSGRAAADHATACFDLTHGKLYIPTTLFSNAHFGAFALNSISQK
jgi:hypothetical protein